MRYFKIIKLLHICNTHIKLSHLKRKGFLKTSTTHNSEGDYALQIIQILQKCIFQIFYQNSRDYKKKLLFYDSGSFGTFFKTIYNIFPPFIVKILFI